MTYKKILINSWHQDWGHSFVLPTTEFFVVMVVGGLKACRWRTSTGPTSRNPSLSAADLHVPEQNLSGFYVVCRRVTIRSSCLEGNHRLWWNLLKQGSRMKSPCRTIPPRLENLVMPLVGVPVARAGLIWGMMTVRILRWREQEMRGAKRLLTLRSFTGVIFVGNLRRPRRADVGV